MFRDGPVSVVDYRCDGEPGRRDACGDRKILQERLASAT
jgi:hypothetical protein